ncbi:MAG: branched-chain amino acid ABC transporter ATP-binding protein/permease [Comamonadaceae bacterium]|nr:MAG: branched-chain amino acid ABC transporter ATP-binding protein/permease [Comamonadaceae bacterium]
MKRTLTGILAAGALLLAVPWLGLPTFYESILYLVCHWMVLALSWNILSGYSGYFSFGHGAFFGIGMYTTAFLAGKQGWPFLATLPFAALLPALLALGLGFVVFRVKAVRGELFALLTLAVTFVVATVILNSPVDGGPGVYLNAVETPKLGPSPSASIYLMIVLVTIVALLVAWRVRESKLGTGLFAIHDDEDVAEVMGVPTFRYKLVAFAISCALAGLAGGIHALFVSYVTASETFNITVPLTVVLMSVLGGTRHWAGPAVGAAAITLLLYAFTAGDHAVAGKAAVGAILVLVILFMPDGVLGFVAKKRKRAGKAAEAAALTPAPLPHAGEGKTVEAPAVVIGKPLLEVHGLSKAFKGVQALDRVSLQVRQGEILGLLGPNGSGKSTFINVVSGHFPLSGGEILFDGRPLQGLPAHRVAHAGIARTYQIPRPFRHMTVLQNVAMVGMFGGASLPRAQATREAWKWLEFTGLQDRAHALPDDINLHQRKFLELARALAARPRLVLLDEVLSGLTPGEINEAIALIRRIRDQGSTIVFVEHVMRAVMALTDRIVVLNHGKLIAQGQAADVMQDQEVVSAYLGRPAHA